MPAGEDAASLNAALKRKAESKFILYIIIFIQKKVYYYYYLFFL